MSLSVVRICRKICVININETAVKLAHTFVQMELL